MSRKTVCAAVMVFVLMAGVACAQRDPAGPANKAMEKMREVMSKQSLSARVVMTMTESKRSSKKTGPMEFQIAFSKGKTCMEMDLAKMAQAVGGDKNAMMPGMDKMVTIVIPDKKMTYQVMPGLDAYCEIVIPEAVMKKQESPQVDRKVVGSENVDKYNCDKVLTTVTAKDGTKSEVFTWEAKELKGLPVKIEATTAEGKMTMMLNDIDTATPADSLFEPPAGATKYPSMQAMMMSMIQKMMQQQR